MDTIVWIIGIGLPIAVLLFVFGCLVGYESALNKDNWGTGFDDGWKAHKEFVAEIRRAEPWGANE